MKDKTFLSVAMFIMFLTSFTSASADNLQKLSEDVRRVVIQTSKGHRASGLPGDRLCVFIRFNSTQGAQLLSQYGCQKVTQIDDIYIANVPVAQLGALAACDEVARIETNISGHLLNDVSPKWTDHSAVNAGTDLPMPYDGTGVLLGIVDCGLDLSHPTLYSIDGKTLRLKGAVDEYAPDTETIGTKTPLGREYLTREELLAKNYSSDTENNHGTHCIGIAAGSGFGTPYRGVAYGADIFAITSRNAADDYKANSADQTARMKRIFDYATEHNQPCVISYSIGFSDFPDDSQLFKECLEKMVGPGRILVAAAGNDNMQCRYLEKSASSVNGSALNLSGSGKAAAYLTTDKPFLLKCFAMEGKYPSLTITDSIVFDSSALPADTTVMGNLHIILEQRSSYYLLTVRDAARTSFAMPIEVSGDAHIKMNTVSSYYLSNLSTEVFGNDRFNGAQFEHNVGLPATLEAAVTIGALNGRQTFTNYKDSVIAGYGLYTPEGAIALFSSCGPTSDGRIKPDAVAPGVNIISAGNRYCKNSYGNSMVTQTLFNGQQYPWIALSGTSMATPCAAGIVALWLQADPTLTPQRIKEVFKNTCQKIERDGLWPNSTYGYGLINAYAGMIEVLRGITGIQTLSSHQPSALTIRPGAGRQVQLSFNQAPTKALNVTVYSVTGAKLHQQTIAPTGATTYTVAVPQAKSGAHIVQVNSQEKGLTGSEIIRW